MLLGAQLLDIIDVSLTTLLVAVIGTIFAVIGTILSGMSYINAKKQSDEKLNKRIKKAFIEKMEWSNEGNTEGNDSIFFDMSIENPEDYHFSGKINYYDNDMNVKTLVFYFDKIVNKNMYLSIRKTNGYKEYGVSKAKLKFINDDLFQIKFCKVWGLQNDNFIPDLPRKTLVFPSPMNDSRLTLTNNIINEISPGRNYAKVNEILGISDKTGTGYSIFEDSMNDKVLEGINSDLFFLKNALLKITTLDQKSIYSITVFPYDRKITLPGIFYPCSHNDNIVGKAPLCKEIIEHATFIKPITTMRDRAKAIQNYTGAPFYRYITYFVDDTPKDEELEGQVIKGFCLSSGNMAFYIYEDELKC